MSAEPNALEGTRGRILEELATAPRTAGDLAETIGIQESAARGHLERLEERGLVVPAFHREGVGRPRKRYVLTPAGQELFPKKYGMILDTVVDELLAREGEGYVSALFAEAGERMARAVADELPSTSSKDERARNLVLALNRIGFGATSERLPDGRYRIVRTNCVFRQSALSHPFLMCEVFDKHLTEALLGEAGVDLEESIGRGGIRCTHLIPLR
ncbi:MAG TPA: helix-turn-helix domain-containing protein [Thermoplasmata archaeon]|nr:helix-turn-helix domain-containing protein [Thermoplasmata archaeon]